MLKKIKMSSLPRARFSTFNKDAKARNIRLQDDEITVADLFAFVNQISCQEHISKIPYLLD